MSNNNNGNNKPNGEINNHFGINTNFSRNLKPTTSLNLIGVFEEAESDKNELKIILCSLQEKAHSYDDEILKQYTSFIDNKKKRFVSLSLDNYYYLSNNISINNLPITHFNYFALIQKNYQIYKTNFHVIFSYIFHTDKLESYNQMFSKNNKFYKVSPKKGNFPKFSKMQSVPPKTLWRIVRSSNYQSFYTCFVFALIEKWIESKNADDLFAFFLDSFRFKNIYPIAFSSFDFHHYSIMLNLIYDAFALGQYDDIKEIFITYFNTCNDIELILTTYVKYCIYFYLKFIYNTNDQTEGKEELSYFEFDEIISPYHEPSRIIIELISNIFNVNIDLYYPNKKAKKFEHVSFTSEKKFNNNNLKIELIYLYASYHLYYSEGNYKLNQLPNFNCLTFHLSESNMLLKCNKCKKKSKYIKYNFKEKEILYCYNCLYDHIGSIMNERTIIFSECFLYKELFARPITLSDGVCINDVEILNCFQESLHDLLMKNLLLNCNVCNQKMPKEEIVALECSCLYCSNCLNEFLTEHFEKTLEKKLTSDMEGKFILNCKKCDKDINLKEVLNIFSSTIELYNKIRKNFFLSHCCLCGKNNKTESSGLIFEPLSVKEELTNSITPEQGTITHNLCWKCYNSILKGKNKDNGNNVNICLICRKPHKIINEKFSDNTQKKDITNDSIVNSSMDSKISIKKQRRENHTETSRCMCIIM